MKVLCVCNGANVRSVALARMLRKRGAEALCCGVDKGFSLDTIKMLLSWADIIYIQKDSLVRLKNRITLTDLEAYNHKIDMRFSVGADDWKSPDHPNLHEIIRNLIINDRDWGDNISVQGIE